jgi:hypothetical protein
VPISRRSHNPVGNVDRAGNELRQPHQINVLLHHMHDGSPRLHPPLTMHGSTLLLYLVAMLGHPLGLSPSCPSGHCWKSQGCWVLAWDCYGCHVRRLMVSVLRVHACHIKNMFRASFNVCTCLSALARHRLVCLEPDCTCV